MNARNQINALLASPRLGLWREKRTRRMVFVFLGLFSMLGLASFSVPRAIAVNLANVTEVEVIAPLANEGTGTTENANTNPAARQLMVDGNDATWFQMFASRKEGSPLSDLHFDADARVRIKFPQAVHILVTPKFQVAIDAEHDRRFDFLLRGYAPNSGQPVFERRFPLDSNAYYNPPDTNFFSPTDSLETEIPGSVDRVEFLIRAHGEETAKFEHADATITFRIIDFNITENANPTCNVTVVPGSQDPNGVASLRFTLQDAASGLSLSPIRWDGDKPFGGIRYIVDNVSFGNVDWSRGTTDPVVIQFYQNNPRRYSRVELWVWDLAGNGPTKCVQELDRVRR